MSLAALLPSIVPAKREDEIRRAHDEAIFGGPTLSVPHAEPTDSTISREESNENIDDKDQGGISNDTSSLVNDKVKTIYKIHFRWFTQLVYSSFKFHWLPKGLNWELEEPFCKIYSFVVFYAPGFCNATRIMERSG